MLRHLAVLEIITLGDKIVFGHTVRKIVVGSIKRQLDCVLNKRTVSDRPRRRRRRGSACGNAQLLIHIDFAHDLPLCIPDAKGCSAERLYIDVFIFHKRLGHKDGLNAERIGVHRAVLRDDKHRAVGKSNGISRMRTRYIRRLNCARLRVIGVRRLARRLGRVLETVQPVGHPIKYILRKILRSRHGRDLLARRRVVEEVCRLRLGRLGIRRVGRDFLMRSDNAEFIHAVDFKTVERAERRHGHRRSGVSIVVTIQRIHAARTGGHPEDERSAERKARREGNDFCLFHILLLICARTSSRNLPQNTLARFNKFTVILFYHITPPRCQGF